MAFTVDLFVCIAVGLIGATYCQTPGNCTRSHCGIGGQCVTNADGVTSRCICFPGYQLNFQNYQCADYNECAYPYAALCPNGRCVNVEGDYKCECPQYYVPHFPDGKTCEYIYDIIYPKGWLF